MTADEHKLFHKALCQNWGSKFNANDLRYWSSRFNDHPFPEVMAALTKFKNTKRFTPKVDEILQMLPAYAASSAPRAAKSNGKPSETTAGDGFVEMVRNTHPWLNKPEISDVEVILRYYRAQWHMATGRDLGGDTMRRKLHRQCSMTLFDKPLEGRGTIDEPTASRMADFIFEPPDAFRVCLADVRGDPFT